VGVNDFILEKALTELPLFNGALYEMNKLFIDTTQKSLQAIEGKGQLLSSKTPDLISGKPKFRIIFKTVRWITEISHKRNYYKKVRKAL